jgi:membrane-associated phospholipid phosphatase
MEGVRDEVVVPRQNSMSKSRALGLCAGAVACLGIVAGSGLLVTRDCSPFDRFDGWGQGFEDWADNHAALETLLRVVEVAFATTGMVVWTTLVAVAVLRGRRYRAAAFAVAVMVATSLLTTTLKLWLGRSRPDWQDNVDVLTSNSFPSGHASASAALAGILIFSAWSFLKREALRWTVATIAIGMWVAVCLDRVLLGRHFPTDVVAGSLLGLAVVLLGLAVFDPARTRAPDR